ncbi:MAG: hypothetical protein KDA28_08330, partial [Phycisphaerales bacterium]|nr:hypothetical protein [Phycisphaerales bacterium]
MRRLTPCLLVACLSLLLPAHVRAQEALRSWYELVSSNGYTGVVTNLQGAVVHHFRDHVFATEEPRWDATGEEIWLEAGAGSGCFKPQAVQSRDLLRDAYFGVRARGASTWLSDRPVDMDDAGYDGFAGRTERDGGTGIVRMPQTLDDLGLRATTRVFAPWDLELPGFVMTLTVENTGGDATGPVQVYALVNPNLGSGRPGPRSETPADFETVRVEGGANLIEQGFAGVVYIASLDGATLATHSPADFHPPVRDNISGDLPAPTETPYLGDGNAGAVQWDVADIAPGSSVTVGVVVAFDPNPDFDEGHRDRIDAWIDGRSATTILEHERAGW